MKTTWQKVYSFFGFWTYNETSFKDNVWKTYLITYWCCFPWSFKRKINIFKWKIKEQTSKELKDEILSLQAALDAKSVS